MLEKEGDLFGETRSKIDHVYAPEMALAAARTCHRLCQGIMLKVRLLQPFGAVERFINSLRRYPARISTIRAFLPPRITTTSAS